MVGTFFEEARPGELKANLIIMWREDNIIEEIVEDSNIEDAIKTVLRKRRRKRSFAGRRILADVPKAVERIRQRIKSGRFKLCLLYTSGRDKSNSFGGRVFLPCPSGRTAERDVKTHVCRQRVQLDGRNYGKRLPETEGSFQRI